MNESDDELLNHVRDNHAGSLRHDAAALQLQLRAADRNLKATTRLVWATWGLFAVGFIQTAWLIISRFLP